MNRYVKTLALVTLLAVVGLQTGCDQHDAVTDAEAPVTVGKGGASDGLGQRLATDRDFLALRKLLHDADQKARLKYIAGANIKADLAFTKSAAKKKIHTRADKARLAKIRGLSEAELQRLTELRAGIVKRYPEVLTLTEVELHGVLREAGLGEDGIVGKTLGDCSGCVSAHNSCSTWAEITFAMTSMACTLLLESVFAAGACYLAALNKYMWTISGCRLKLHSCLNANGCTGTAINDTV